VVGIVASRIVERLHRPVFVLCQTEDGKIKGSGRSVPGINLVAALHRCADLLLAFGGHEAAAGATLAVENLKAFARRFNEAIAAQKPATAMQKTLSADAELKLNEINFELLAELESLEPFGMGNAKPLFVSKALAVQHKRVVGENHLKLTLRHENKLIDAIAFGKADEFAKLSPAIDLLYGLEINEFNNRQSIQMVVKDFIKVEGAT
jgi:single-stranded-DNA-specific exonuclease